MLMPSIFGESLFDDWMDFPFDRNFFNGRDPMYGKYGKDMMKTDIRETDNSYELDIDLPGFKKEDVSAQLRNKYLTISASKQVDNDEKDKEGKYIRKERYSGSCTRSFYVGEQVKEEDIKARFEDGILKISFPKNGQQNLEENRYIAIEG